MTYRTSHKSSSIHFGTIFNYYFCSPKMYTFSDYLFSYSSSKLESSNDIADSSSSIWMYPYSSPLNNTIAFNGILHKISIASHTCIFLHSRRLLISYMTDSFRNCKIATKFPNAKRLPNKKWQKRCKLVAFTTFCKMSVIPSYVDTASKF